MDSLYSIGVRLSMDTAGFGSTTTLAIGLLQKLEQRAIATSGSTASLGKSLGLVAGGMALIAGGVAGVAVLKSWVSAAGDLQNAMAGVGLSTQGTVAQLKALQDQTFITANKTQFSAVDIAGIEKLAATNGLNQRDVLLRVIPTLGNLAEIDKQMRGISYDQSVPAAVTVAHDFQAYPKNAAQTKSFTDLLDLFGRSQLVAGTSPEQMARLVTYLAPAHAALGISPRDIIATAALASNVGLAGGHGGGSTVAALFRTIVPLMSARGGVHNRALQSVETAGHGSFFDKGGQFEGVTNMLNVVMRAMSATTNQQQRLMLLNAAFGAAGARAFSVLATPGAVGRYASIQGLLGSNGIASTSVMQSTLNATLPGQLATLSGNLTSIKALLGTQLLPAIAPVLHGFVELTGGVVTLLRTHPELAQFITTFVAVSTAAALIAGPILIAAGAFGILSAAGFTADLAFLPFTAVVLGIVAAISAAVFIFTHWGDIMKFLGGVVSDVGTQIGGFLTLAGGLLSVFGDIAGAGAHLLGLDTLAKTVGGVAGAFYGWWFQVLHLKDALKWAGTELQSFLRWLGILHNPPQKGTHTVAVAATTTSKPGSVHATATESGTAGMPTYLTIPPIKGAKGGGGAMVPAAPITINIHPGAAPIHIHPAAHQSAAEIAREAVAMQSKALAKDLHDSLNRDSTSITSLMPSTHTMRAS